MARRGKASQARLVSARPDRTWLGPAPQASRAFARRNWYGEPSHRIAGIADITAGPEGHRIAGRDIARDDSRGIAPLTAGKDG